MTPGDKRGELYRAAKLQGLQWCNKCEKALEPQAFHPSTRGVFGQYCIECKKEMNAKRKTAAQFRLHGLKPSERTALIAQQNGKCAVCEIELGLLKPSLVHVDHDHRTGRVRGVICARCNVGMGYFSDDPQVLLRMVDYLTTNEKE